MQIFIIYKLFLLFDVLFILFINNVLIICFYILLK